jgi:UDP-3-O-[3-hydroxymyristoyl] glucosamine N-acyltransferase
MAVATCRPWTLAELAQQFELELRGDGTGSITGIATLASAGANDLSFLANPRYRNQLQQTKAAAVILRPQDAEYFEGVCLISSDPYLSYARVASICQLGQDRPAAVHATACIGEHCRIADGVIIDAHALIGDHCQIADRCRIGPGAVIEPGVVIAADAIIGAGVWIGAGTRLGARVQVHPGAVLGSDGFGLAWSGQGWEKVPQLGGLEIGDDCEIGANTTIDRGSIDNTVLEADVRLDNQIQIAHNVHIGRHTAIAACTGIAGSTRIGRRCLIGGGCGIGGHLHIADDVELTGMSMVTRSLTEAGAYGSAVPAEPVRVWRRNMARLRQLDRLLRDLMNGNKHA